MSRCSGATIQTARIEFARVSQGSVARLLFAPLAMAAALFASSASAAEPKPRAATSRAIREEAKQLIPYDKLSPEGKQKVTAVLADITMFRRLPTQVIECDPKLYLFLVEHPELVVNIWEVLGISDVALQRSGDDTFKADDGAGTVGNVEFLYRSHDLHLVFAEGSYDGSLFNRPVRGQCILMLKTGYVRETNGRYYITCRLDAFLRMQHAGVEFLAKTFQPLVGSVADHNFRETTGFVENLSRAAEMNHAGLQTITEKLDHVTPEARETFAEITREIAVQAAVKGTPRMSSLPLVRKPEMQAKRH